MDRNNPLETLVILPKQSLSARRAWIEILRAGSCSYDGARSLSARRAWIEILSGLWAYLKGVVALRKESVDRNESNSPIPTVNDVALRKESVDRNKVILTAVGSACCRSPQGERG